MAQEELQRETVIHNIVGLLRSNPFSFEFKVVKKPKGIKVIYEVTQDEMNTIMEMSKKKHE